MGVFPIYKFYNTYKILYPIYLILKTFMVQKSMAEGKEARHHDMLDRRILSVGCR
jgi:hypothetical protein